MFLWDRFTMNNSKPSRECKHNVGKAAFRYTTLAITMTVRTGVICFLSAVFLAVAGLYSVAAQDELRLQLVDVDPSKFPTIRITLVTSDEISAPVTDLSQLTLRENGAPVTDISFDTVPTGVDVTFVIDAKFSMDK